MWIAAEEEKNLKEKFKWMEDIYTKLLDTLLRVQIQALRLSKTLSEKQMSNCKILSQKLTQMQIDFVRPKLLKQIKTMFDFYF